MSSQYKPPETRIRVVEEDPVVSYDLEQMQASIESGTVRLPGGLTREERREWIHARAKRERPDWLTMLDDIPPCKVCGVIAGGHLLEGCEESKE